jgi:hypothetical protein
MHTTLSEKLFFHISLSMTLISLLVSLDNPNYGL